MEERVKALEEELESLKTEMKEMLDSFGVEKVIIKEQGDKVVAVMETTHGTMTVPTEKQDAISVHPSSSFIPVTPGKGGGPPAGMTPDQLQDFKKQGLQINALQTKNKELETKLTETTAILKTEGEKLTVLEEREDVDVKDLYEAMDHINTSLSEKIANQRIEMQKLAGDTPKPINYDPFNYGEPYAGDIVDFQARKRITEIKLMLQGLQATMTQMRDSVKVSPSIDLGYKVVRLDQLVGSTGFAKQVEEGEVSKDQALLVGQSEVRTPSKVNYPRKESSKTTTDMESKWAITDSIMQTMYRLEMELGELQQQVKASDMSENSKVIEDLHVSINALREKQVDVKTVRRMIEDYVNNALPPNTTGRPSFVKGQLKGQTGTSLTALYDQAQTDSSHNDPGTRLNVCRLDSAVQTLKKTCKNLALRLSELEDQPVRRYAAGLKQSKDGGGTAMTGSCLSCGKRVEPESKDPKGGNATKQAGPSCDSKARSDVCPPCSCIIDPALPGNPPERMRDIPYLMGQDGKFYKADKEVKVDTHEMRLQRKQPEGQTQIKKEKEG